MKPGGKANTRCIGQVDGGARVVSKAGLGPPDGGGEDCFKPFQIVIQLTATLCE